MVKYKFGDIIYSKSTDTTIMLSHIDGGRFYHIFCLQPKLGFNFQRYGSEPLFYWECDDFLPANDEQILSLKHNIVHHGFDFSLIMTKVNRINDIWDDFNIDYSYAEKLIFDCEFLDKVLLKQK